MSDLFKEYTGFNVDYLSSCKVVEIKDLGDKANYSGVYLIGEVDKDKVSLVDNSGGAICFPVKYFTDNFGEYAPYPRMIMTVIK